MAQPTLDAAFAGEFVIAEVGVIRPRQAHNLLIVASPDPVSKVLRVYVYECWRGCTSRSFTGAGLRITGRTVTLDVTVPGDVGRLQLTGTLDTVWSAYEVDCKSSSGQVGQPGQQNHWLRAETVNAAVVTWHPRKGNPTIKPRKGCALYATTGVVAAIRDP